MCAFPGSTYLQLYLVFGKCCKMPHPRQEVDMHKQHGISVYLNKGVNKDLLITVHSILFVTFVC